MPSDVARFCDALGQQSQWPSLTEIKKKSRLFIEYPFVSITGNLLSAKIKLFFSLKFSFSRPFNSAARYGRTTPPLPGYAPRKRPLRQRMVLKDEPVIYI